MTRPMPEPPALDDAPESVITICSTPARRVRDTE